jgi:DNA polymerase I
VTGRNSPSTSKYIFGPAKWMRNLIKPAEGQGVAYLDWHSQEIAVSAGLSGDERMIEAVCSGDPYLSFGRDSGLLPPDATKKTHGRQREQFKIVVLGTLYGMQKATLAMRLGIMPCEAAELLQRHHRTYPTFWRWVECTKSVAFSYNRLASIFGWPVRITARSKATQIANFPVQSGGAEMMRLAAIAATENGIEVCGPIHDAFLIAGPIERLNEDIARMAAIMRRAGEVVAGFPVEVDDGESVAKAAWPSRYTEEKGLEMFNKVRAYVSER